MVDGVADDAQTQYLCNGAQGQNGQNGQNGQGGQSGLITTMKTTRFDGAQGDCANGGVKIEVLFNGIVDAAQTQYICNGAQGQNGQNGQNGQSGQSGIITTMKTTKFDGAEGDCAYGGVKIEFLVNGTVDDAQTQYICNGAQGEQGQTQCQTGWMNCNGVCTDVSADMMNCGACAHSCNDSKPQHASTMSCIESQCSIAACEDGYLLNDGQCVSCDSVAGWARCNNKCVQTDSDNQNCGGCGKVCPDGLTCGNGQCLGNTTCSGKAVNTDSSLDHCGTCNNRCSNGKTCIEGKCVTGYGKAYCGDDIVQIGNIDRCSGCGDLCAEGKICKDNACVDGAGPSYCAGIATNTLSDVSNCGECGKRCENSNCVNGECVASQGGYSTDEMYCNGVLVHALSDSANCNGCGNTCARGLMCSSGTCQPYEFNSSSKLICNGKTVNHPYNDSSNCGACGNVCKKGHSCSGGKCTGTSTDTLTCDGKTVNPYNDSSNCGGCGVSCGTGKCFEGTCGTYTRDDIITFGHYEQDGDAMNGKEPITWRVLDKNASGQYLVISEKVLDVKPYNTSRISITWEKSTIRSWLNGYPASYNTVGTDFSSDNFIDTAFTAAEIAQIVTSNVPAQANPDYNTTPGNETNDKIFLLRITDAENYFKNNDERKADATRYAIKNEAYVYGSSSGNYTLDGTCTDVHCYSFWWLRSPGSQDNTAAIVYDDGYINSNGYYVNSARVAVRPAFWVNL